MDYAKLKALIAADATLQGKTAQEIAEALNAPSIEVFDRIYPATFQRWLSNDGRKLRLKAAAENVALPIDLRNAIDCALDMKYTPEAHLDFSLTEQRQFAAGLVATGVLQQAEVDLLVNGSKRTISPAEKEGLGVVQTSDIDVNWLS